MDELRVKMVVVLRAQQIRILVLEGFNPLLAIFPGLCHKQEIAVCI